MSSSNTIYLDDITMNFTITDTLQGKGPIYIANPYFLAPGANAFDEKKYFKVKSTTDKATYYDAPAIYFKTSAGALIANPNICLTANRGSKTRFTFWKPYDASAAIKSNLKLTVSYGSEEMSNKLIILEQRLVQMLDILLVSYILKIDLKPYANLSNNDFYTKFNTEISAVQKTKIGNKKPVIYTEAHIGLWNEPYIHVKFSDTDKARISPDTFNTRLDDVEESCGAFDVRSVFGSLLKNYTLPGFNGANGMLGFTQKKTSKKNKDNQFVVRNDHMLRFKIKMPNSKVPDDLISKQISKKGGKLINATITSSTAPMLWGGMDSKRASYEGFIMVNIRFDLSLYKLGNSYCVWEVKSFNGKPCGGSSAVLTESDMPDVSDDDDDLPQPSEASKTGGTIQINDSDDDDLA